MTVQDSGQGLAQVETQWPKDFQELIEKIFFHEVGEKDDNAGLVASQSFCQFCIHVDGHTNSCLRCPPGRALAQAKNKTYQKILMSD